MTTPPPHRLGGSILLLLALGFGGSADAMRVGIASRTQLRMRRVHMMASSEDGDAATNWDEAMQQLRKREAQAQGQADTVGGAEGAPSAPSASTDAFRFAPPLDIDGGELTPPPLPPPPPPPPPLPPPSAAEPSAFRFAAQQREEAQYTAGLDKRDEALLRNATLYGGRLLTAITLGSLAFYLYVGLTGGARPPPICRRCLAVGALQAGSLFCPTTSVALGVLRAPPTRVRSPRPAPARSHEPSALVRSRTCGWPA